MWMEEVAHFKKFCVQNQIPAQAPNTMNNYGVILDDIGFYDMIQEIIDKVVTPVAKKLWSGIGEDSLDHHHAFTVEYGLDKDKRLELHRDSSAVTLNYCLGTDFKGGYVNFQGMRCIDHYMIKPDPRTEEFSYENVPGQALIHLGNHMHLAEDIISGERYNIIIWAKSQTWYDQNP